MYWTNPGHEFDMLFEKDTEYRLWGMAELGHQFIERFKNQLKIVQVVDIDTDKQGKYVENLLIQKPDELIYNENSVVVVTCSFYDENRPFIEEKGYTPFVNLFYYEDFYIIYGVYQNNYLKSKRVDISLTEKCTLRCEKCNMFMPYFENPKNQLLQDVLSDIDAYFSVVDEVREVNLLGGEPFLYPEVKPVVDYIEENYINRIGKLVFFTNGMIVPSDEVCESLKKCNAQMRISDYTFVIPYEKKLQEFCRKMDNYEIENFVIKYETWGDFGFPDNCNDLEESKMLDFFNNCRAPFRGLWSKKVYFCHLETSAVRAGIYEDNKNDFFDMSKEQGDDRKKLFVEFDYGYHHDGYVSFCKKCRGCDCVNPLIVPAAQQKGK